LGERNFSKILGVGREKVNYSFNSLSGTNWCSGIGVRIRGEVLKPFNFKST